MRIWQQTKIFLLLVISVGLLFLNVDNAYAVVNSVVINEPTAGQSFGANFSIDYTVGDDGANTAVAGSITFTRTGGTADPNSPHTYVMGVPADTSTGNHVIGRAALEAGFGNALVDGTEYTIVVSVSDPGPITDTELVVTADFTAPSFTAAKGPADNQITITWDENVDSVADSPTPWSVTGGGGITVTGTTALDGTGNVQTLTLSGDIPDGASMTVSYDTDDVNGDIEDTANISPNAVPDRDNIAVSGISAAQPNGSSSHKWQTKPTFGASHNPGKQLVSCGFKMDTTCYDITDNFHTPFDKVTIHTGSTHDFGTKIYAQHGLKLVEFGFVPEIGSIHKAEVLIEAWLKGDYTLDKVVVRQKENIVDESKISVTVTKNGLEYNVQINDVKFLEQPFFEVIAITAVDFKNRAVVTYLNEGIDVVGKSYNEQPTVQIPSEQKYDGLQTLTRVDKFTDIWENKDGISYTKNEFDTWKRLTPITLEKSDEGVWNVMTRLNDNFVNILDFEKNRNYKLLKEMHPELFEEEPFAEIDDIFAYEFSEIERDRLVDTMLK